jgi:hypothetical protein
MFLLSNKKNYSNMKKGILMALSIIVMTFAYSSANSWKSIDAVSPDEGEKTEVKSTDLPQAVRDVLASSDYRGWRAEENAYLVRKKDGSQFYKITLRNAETNETRTIKMDRNGKEMKSADRQTDGQTDRQQPDRQSTDIQPERQTPDR